MSKIDTVEKLIAELLGTAAFTSVKYNISDDDMDRFNDAIIEGLRIWSKIREAQ